MKNEQRGFTLIELVMVIVILGVLAAVALPKFVDLGNEARRAAISGAAGALSSAAVINYSGYQANSTMAGVVRLSAAGAGATLRAGMATWDAKFAIGTDGACGAVAGATVQVTLSHTDNSANTATATIICTG